MEVEPGDAINQLGPIAVFVLVGMRIISIPVGFAIAVIVRRMLPAVNAITAALFAGYAVGFTVIFVVLLRILPELAWYDCAAISLVVTAGLVFFVAYVIKRTLYAHEAELKRDQAFTVFEEDQRGKPKNLRRRKR
ncbi:MAG: hypothetical protein K8L97_28040 [Anaerolineae bacterium]|nr:hypothetical protein [Anaerolineae bacterium]